MNNLIWESSLRGDWIDGKEIGVLRGSNYYVSLALSGSIGGRGKPNHFRANTLNGLPGGTTVIGCVISLPILARKRSW